MRKYGYTLIELLVVISITGLIFAIGFVSFRDFARRQALAGQTRKIVGDIKLAQGSASSGKKPPSCAGVLDGYTFTVNADSYITQSSCDSAMIPIKEVSLDPDFSLEVVGQNPITFKVLGQGTDIPAGTFVQIVVTQISSGAQNVITVNSSGEIL